jgi:hypothetical protein
MAEAFANNPPASRSLDDVIAQGYTLRTFEYLREGWKAFADNPVGFLGFTLALTLTSQAIPLLAPFVGQLFSLAIQMLMLAGIALVTWRQLRNQRSTWGDFFPGWQTTAQVFLVTVVGLHFIAVGFFLLVIPGIYLTVAYTFSYLLIVDRGTGVWQSLEGSRRVVNKHWWGVRGWVLVMVIVMVGAVVVGAVGLGLPIGYGLSGFFPQVNLDELPLVFPETGLTISLGIWIGVMSGMMIGGAVGVAVAGCMLGAAYADIFGLPSLSQSLP